MSGNLLEQKKISVVFHYDVVYGLHFETTRISNSLSSWAIAKSCINVYLNLNLNFKYKKQATHSSFKIQNFTVKLFIAILFVKTAYIL